ncbi:MAG: TetR/AcrR family transcriptional regulator [Zavarzinella sp.]
MGDSEKKPGRPANPELRSQRTEAILDVAAQLFAEQGFASTDLQLIADRCGVAKGTIYHYFPNKEELFLAAVDRGLEQLNAAIDSAIADCTDILEIYRRAIVTFLKYFEQHRDLVELFLQERALFKDRKMPAYFAMHEQKCGEWQAMHQELIAQGRGRHLPPDNDPSIFNDFLYGTIIANHVTGRQVSSEEQAAKVIDIFFHGILSESERKNNRE